MTRITLPKERQVGHLTLHRQGRKISVKEYNALSAAERMEIIRQARGKEKYDLLLNAADAEKLTPQLHPQELYLTINELGSEYSTELLMLASSEQITTLLDLDCWEGDTVSPLISLQWLQLLLETGPEKVCQLAEELEPEILAIFLKKHMVITRGLEAYDDDDAENAKRLESLYDIDFTGEDAAKTITAFLRILMEHAQETYLLLMEMVRSEVTASLEEEVFQSRNNRLADLGFTPPVEAKAIYSYIDPERFTPGSKTDYRLEAAEFANPGALLAQANPENLLAEVLTNSLNHELASELCMLANRKMSADQTDISSSDEVGGSLQELYDILNLALEYLAATDVAQAEQVVRATYLSQLFQLGSSLLQQAQTTARELLKSPIGPYFDYPEQLFLDTLCEKPPAIYQAATEEMPSSLQPIKTINDLKLVQIHLQQIVELHKLFCDILPFDLPHDADDAPTGTSLSSIFLTAIANQLLGREFSPAPLSVEDLLLLKGQTLEQGQLKPGFRETLQSTLAKLDISCQFFIDFCLECWHDDLNYIDVDNLDPDDQICLFLKE